MTGGRVGGQRCHSRIAVAQLCGGLQAVIVQVELDAAPTHRTRPARATPAPGCPHGFGEFAPEAPFLCASTTGPLKQQEYRALSLTTVPDIFNAFQSRNRAAAWWRCPLIASSASPAGRKDRWEQLTNGRLDCAVQHTVGQHRMQPSGQVGHNARMLKTVAERVHAEQAIQGSS